jgi:hypothetical protein
VPTDEVETGEPMRVELRYRASRPIHNPSVTMLIERLDGLVCHEASTKTSGVSWKRWEGDGLLTLDYEALNLLPNTYQIILTIHEDKNPSPLVRLSRQLYFHITSNNHGARGTVHLDHEWSLEEADPAHDHVS